MIWLIGLHLVVAAGIGLFGSRSQPVARVSAALPPLATTAFAVSSLGGSRGADLIEFTWVAGLDIGLALRLDDFALLLTLIVSGIGSLIVVYSGGYFRPDAPHQNRLLATLLLFAASMLLLVWAESVWTLFIAWELTSVTSFLLVGHTSTSGPAQAAARRALMITGAGGLSLLAGLLVLTSETGTTLISEMTPVSGPSAAVAAVLIMGAVATKSAQVPFHAWLPGAMAAPTPVSAYLHSATMVKAGVVLLALLTPVLGDVAWWSDIGLALGGSSMLWGALVALRHVDAKLILAWGTISQLGFLVTLLSAGSDKMTFAAISVLIAHALFKAALFMVVGEVDVRTGTRQIDELGGLARSMPIAATVAALAGCSMAGLPPLLGFASKEAAVEGALALTGTRGAIVAALVIGGSVLTVAYTLRFWLGVFGPGPATEVAPRRLAMTLPHAVLAAVSLAGGLFVWPASQLAMRSATVLGAESTYKLYLWPGFTPGLQASIGIVTVGLTLGALASRRVGHGPAPRGANIVDGSIEGLLELARRITAVVQHGSLPVYLVTMLGVAAIAGVPFLFAGGFDNLVLWDSPMQGALVAVVIAAAGFGAIVPSRLGGALTLGAVGVAMTGLFLVQGAPDLALTQLLVETVIVVGFVLGMGSLRRDFPPVAAGWGAIRLGVSGLLSLVVMAALAASSGGPSVAPPIDTLVDGAVQEGGGRNVVNVILTDLRALDTLGEVVVLATVALGILALSRSIPGTPDNPADPSTRKQIT